MRGRARGCTQTEDSLAVGKLSNVEPAAEQLLTHVRGDRASARVQPALEQPRAHNQTLLRPRSLRLGIATGCAPPLVHELSVLTLALVLLQRDLHDALGHALLG